jgi:hypothetical protein
MKAHHLSVRVTGVSVFALVLAGAFPGVAAADSHMIYGCAQITEPGNYVLATDIIVDTTCLNPDFPGSVDPPEPAGLAGIYIAASNVHLDLNGKTVYGDPAGYPEGYAARGISTAASPQTNVRIINGRVDGNNQFGRGIYIDIAKNVRISAVESVNNNGEGMLMAFCEDCSVRGSRFAFNGGAGVQTVFAGRDGDGDGVNGAGVTFHGNEFTDNPNSNGLTIYVFPAAHKITGNTFARNGGGIGEGIGFGQVGHVIQGNKVHDNLYLGIGVCTGNNTIRANHVSNNGGNGITTSGFCIGPGIRSGSLFQANHVSGSTGVDLDGSCANTWKANRFETDSEGDGPRKGCIR